MKQQLKKWISVTACLFFVFAATAQPQKKSPRWLPENGYWVIESNTQTPKNHIVHFYTNDNVQIYSEKINGRKLNVNQRKVKMKLKEVLDLSMTAWIKNQHPEADKDYLAVLLK